MHYCASLIMQPTIFMNNSDKLDNIAAKFTKISIGNLFQNFKRRLSGDILSTDSLGILCRMFIMTLSGLSALTVWSSDAAVLGGNILIPSLFYENISSHRSQAASKFFSDFKRLGIQIGTEIMPTIVIPK